MEATLDGLLADDAGGDLFPVPESVSDPRAFGELRRRVLETRKGGPEAERAKRELRRAEMEAMQSLRAWWIQRMRYAPQPLRENMVLFWHGHFASSIEKVRGAHLLWKQNEMFREHALGSFASLARAVVRDPAMMRYLDVAGSRKGKPNENFARELMELFLLGEGNYSEQDIKEAARAFTGLRVNPDSLDATMAARQHDGGPKTVLGRTGNFGPEDVVGVLLDQPSCARFIAGKLWVYFTGSPLEDPHLDDLAAGFRESGYQTGPLVRRILASEGFHASRGRQIKSPVQWLVGSAIALEAPLDGSPAQQNALRELGQDLFAPPNVKGWEGGRAWISSTTLLARCNLAGSLFVAKLSKPSRLFDPGALSDPAALRASAERRLLAVPAAAASRRSFDEFLAGCGMPAGEDALADLIRLVMSSPEYQIT